MKIKKCSVKGEEFLFLLDGESNKNLASFRVENCEADGYISDFLEFLDSNKVVKYVDSKIESGLIKLGNIYVELHLLSDDTFYWRGFGDLMRQDLREDWMDNILKHFGGDELKLEEWKRNQEKILLEGFSNGQND